MNLNALQSKSTRYAVGIMSGTSCDGIDIALVRIKGTGSRTLVKLMKFATVPYSSELRLRLLDPRMDIAELTTLNFDLGDQIASAALKMVEAAQDNGVGVDFISWSGHTISHIPPRNGNAIGTLQIGESAFIAERCRLPVVSDFRQRDMAVGGQGAPLVPYADWLLFHRDDRTIACLNIGGIVNITVVPPAFEDIAAFDIGPGNMVIDGAVRLLTGGNEQMDEDGRHAAQGVVVDEFLDFLLDHPYFTQAPPKSTGREEFGPDVYLRDALSNRRDHSFDDLIATVTTAVAYSVVRAFNRFVKADHDITRMVLSGGGSHNVALVDRIRQGLPEVEIRQSDDYGISADAREAVAFAILGNETICGTPANVPSATGAKRMTVLGKITPP